MRLSFSTRGWQRLGWEELLETTADAGLEGVELYDLSRRTDLTQRGGPFDKYNILATARQLREKGIPFSPRGARLLTHTDYDRYDYLIGMDEENLDDMHRICRGDPEKKISLLLDWAGISRDVADPWYTGNFEATYQDLITGCTALLNKLFPKGRKV